MGTAAVDQILFNGALVRDVDTTLSRQQRNDLLLAALPGAAVGRYAGEQVIVFEDQVILKKQVTYLGKPWQSFKKRIQIPPSWKDVYRQALANGLTPRFIGIYHYRGLTLFVDFDPVTYVQRKANNSAAHVATNDLHQAQIHGVFSRTDSNGNALTTVKPELLASHLLGRLWRDTAYLDAFQGFNDEFLTGRRVEALNAVREMHAAQWPDAMQSEWAGFYLEYRVDEFLRRTGMNDMVSFQKVKQHGVLDYDLVFKDHQHVAYYGDLKASNIALQDSPGNDAADLKRCVEEFGRFWYVIYEHDTWHSRDAGNEAVIAWNEWRRSVGHAGRKDYDPLSYAGRFKSAVRFAQMKILEINKANFDVVLGNFQEGYRQPDGAPRALKVMIKKSNIDNFLIYSTVVD